MERKIEITSDEILAGGGVRYVKGDIVTGSEIGLRCLVDTGMAKWADEPALPPAAPAAPPPPEAEESAEPTATTSRKRAATTE